MRPVCGARECLTKRTSYLLSKLLAPIIPQGGTQCESTDELLAEFERVNKQRDADPRWVVGSLDVKSLYPSLDIEVCAIVVAKAVMDSGLVFENLQWQEIGLYLRYQMEEGLLSAEGLLHMCPRRRYDRRPPVFECSGSDPNKDKRYDPWIFPEEVPSEEEVRWMFCVAIGAMVKRTIELHDYVIDGRIFRQGKGGSIGSGDF